MEQVNITITVKSPTLIANSSTAGVLTSTRGFIDGRVLRGLFASQFISSHKLGREAHQCADLCQIRAAAELLCHHGARDFARY